MRAVYVREPELAEKLFRFRYDMYVTHYKLISNKDYPDGLMYDNFDNSSYNYAALDNKGKVIGSIRIIMDNSQGLLLYKYHRINNFYNRHFFAELNRLVVNPKYKYSFLGTLIMKTGYQCADKYGATYIVIGTSQDLQGLYMKMGFRKVSDKSYALDVPLTYRIAIALDCRTAQKEWPYTHPRLYQFITKPDNRIEHPE